MHGWVGGLNYQASAHGGGGGDSLASFSFKIFGERTSYPSINASTSNLI